ncbi:retrovirus-related pol polyprotein from transposon TNT 1-94 [Tanacetum coccineum]
MKVEESLNVTFDESPPPTKLSPLVDDDVGEEEAIRKNTRVVNNNNEEDESIEVDEVINIKESKNHPLDQVIGNLNQRTILSQAQNHSNLFYFISTIEPKNVNEALKDESWIIAMQEELNQFVANDVWDLVPLSMSQSVIGTKWVFRNKLDENGIVSRNKARVHRSRQMDEELRESYRTLEKRLFHEGRIVTPSFIAKNNMLPFFQAVGLEPFLILNEPICPIFVVEFYHSIEVKRDEEERPYIEFKLGQFSFKLTSS